MQGIYKTLSATIYFYVLLQVFSSNQSSDGKLRDYCDGLTYEAHELFQHNPHALQIILHYDDLELCNPLGSKASIHKVGRLMYLIKWPLMHAVSHVIGVFYFSLANLKPSLRAALPSIQLVSLALSSTIDKYGIDVILQPFVTDLCRLEEVTCNLQHIL